MGFWVHEGDGDRVATKKAIVTKKARAPVCQMLVDVITKRRAHFFFPSAPCRDPPAAAVLSM
jgi:hypothetical protein